jgi:hypothetical protein
MSFEFVRKTRVRREMPAEARIDGSNLPVVITQAISAGDGAFVRLWRGKLPCAANSDPTEPERLWAIQEAVSHIEESIAAVARRVEAKRGNIDADAVTELRAGHTALSRLQDRLAVQARLVATLCAELQRPHASLLATWRVTEREILASDAVALGAHIRDVSGQMKCVQVDIAAQLIELR